MNHIPIHQSVVRTRGTLIAILTSLLIVGTVVTHAAEADFDRTLKPQVVARGGFPDITVDRDGGLHIVYIRHQSRSPELYYRKLDRAEGVWSPEIASGIRYGSGTNDGPHRAPPRVVVDSTGRPHVFVSQTYARQESDGTWFRIPLGVTRDSDMVIDSQDRIYICRRNLSPDPGYIGILTKHADDDAFIRVTDPDTGTEMGTAWLGGHHPYAQLAIGPDNSIHVSYRQGQPANVGYRYSTDGGQTWDGGGIAGSNGESPDVHVTRQGVVHITDAFSRTFRFDPPPRRGFSVIGVALRAASRDLPNLASDESGNIYITAFGGEYNIHSDEWLVAREAALRLPSPTCNREFNKLGFARLAAGRGDYVYVVYEVGRPIINNDDFIDRNELIVVATIQADGSVETPVSAFWENYPAFGEYQRSAGRFGVFFTHRAPWVFHVQMGWIYFASNDPENFTIYSPDLGWLYTNPHIFPYAAHFESGAWYFVGGSHDRRRYYSLSEESWLEFGTGQP